MLLKGISDQEYEHAQRVWNRMWLKFEDVTLYLSKNRCLADVFETSCLKHYKLDPVYFHTALGLAWQAALKYRESTPL